ncbi:MAG: hypothetical protein N2V75_03580 [Methanophagales archaeon]|nr:hypothetical protein [Methanophagales archaeon]
MKSSQLFATLMLGLSFAETPITADKRLRYAPPKLPAATPFIFYPQYVRRNSFMASKNLKEDVVGNMKNNRKAIPGMLYILVSFVPWISLRF